jgi:hypothetical protein
MLQRAFPRRIFLLAFLAVIGLVWLAGCQPGGPKIEISPAERDLGQTKQVKLETSYTVRNSGSQPLKISKVYTSCDCTKATIEREVIPPGETAELKVTMDPALLNLYGKIRRDIILETNDPRQPTAKAIFRVEIAKP